MELQKNVNKQKPWADLFIICEYKNYTVLGGMAWLTCTKSSAVLPTPKDIIVMPTSQYKVVLQL